MDSNIILMIIMKYLVQARDEPIRYAEITMKKVISMYILYLRYKKLQEGKKKRKMWVRPIFTERRRLLQGASDNLLVEMRLGDAEKYFNYLRMSPIIFTELLNIVGPLIEKQHVVRQPIPARTRLEVTVRWLASGDSMTSLSYAYRIAQCTLSGIIPETCEAIWLSLKEKVLINPTEENWSTIAEDFETTCQFPHCIGAIDGKHVEIQAPLRSGSCYYNYKGKHSINLLAVSDAKNRFTIVDIGAEGRQSDGGVFENSGLPHLLETNALHIPLPTRLNNMDLDFP
ncbi:nuclease harbi1-like protein, partial [Lasius niger]